MYKVLLKRHCDDRYLTKIKSKMPCIFYCFYGYMKNPAVETSLMVSNEDGYIKNKNIVLLILFL